MRTMRHYLVLLAAVVATAAVASAASGNPHFIRSATGASMSGSSLVCSFKEAGLSAGSTETIVCQATETVTYECVNNGGKNPQASNKTSTTTTGSASGQFPVDQNGNLTGTLTVTPQSAQQVGFSCPGGQTVTFVGVSYSNVTITDLTSGASTSVSGTLSFTNPAAP